MPPKPRNGVNLLDSFLETTDARECLRGLLGLHPLLVLPLGLPFLFVERFLRLGMVGKGCVVFGDGSGGCFHVWIPSS